MKTRENMKICPSATMKKCGKSLENFNIMKCHIKEVGSSVKEYSQCNPTKQLEINCSSIVV